MKLYKLLVALSMGICLLQIWLPEYYLTGDGPTHLYNAKMLKDFWQGEHQDFYSKFYTINTHIDPNWFGHIVLAILLYVATPSVAEKILITLYAFTLVAGIWQLVKTTKADKHLVFIGFLFLFTHLLVKGFYNFSFGVALFIWLLWAWLRCLQSIGAKGFLLFAVLAIVTFSAHPVGFIYGVVVCGLLTVSYSFFNKEYSNNRKLTIFLKNTGVLLLGLTPGIILQLLYFSRHNTAIDLANPASRWEQLFHFGGFVVYSTAETKWAHVTGYTLLSLLVVSFIQLFRNADKRYAGIGAFVIFCFVLYLFIPESMAGGSIMDMRAAQLLLLSFGLAAIFSDMPSKLSVKTGIVCFVLFAGISASRLPVLWNIGKAVKEYEEVAEDIEGGAMVLPLSYSHNGKLPDGTKIADRAWIFQHMAGYMASGKKHMILMDNYEANTGYFPFIWLPGVNPYSCLSVGNGFEAQLPGADISAYEEKTRMSIGYIMMWCYSPEAEKTPHIKEMMDYINNHYTKVKVSKTGRVILYKLHSLSIQ